MSATACDAACLADLEGRLSLLEDQIEAMQKEGLARTDDVNVFWVLICGILVFLMQVGFAMLEVGSVSPKNTKAVLVKNIGDASIGALCWWLVGWGVAYGDDSGGVIGTTGFALKGDLFEPPGDDAVFSGTSYAEWMFNWAFAATSVTIVSGAIAERVKITGYVYYSIVLTSFIYPMVVHWAWSSGGWASAYRETEDHVATSGATDFDSLENDLLVGCGAADFAGSGVVHMVGGLAALVAAMVARPRLGRFSEDGTVNRLPQQSSALQTLGTLILWCGWYGFNAGSTLVITGGRSVVAAKAMVSTTIAPTAGVLTIVLILKTTQKKFDSSIVNNGILAALVAITAGAPVVEPEGAFVIGVVSAVVYYLSSALLLRYQVDDVVDASPVHFFGGLWGMIATGFLASEEGYLVTYANGVAQDTSQIDFARAQRCKGIFYGGDGSLLAANLALVAAIISWTAVLSLILFYGIKYTVGLRVPLHVEESGMDRTRHGAKRRHVLALQRAIHKATGGRGTGADNMAVSRHGSGYSSYGGAIPMNASVRDSGFYGKNPAGGLSARDAAMAEFVLSASKGSTKNGGGPGGGGGAGAGPDGAMS